MRGRGPTGQPWGPCLHIQLSIQRLKSPDQAWRCSPRCCPYLTSPETRWLLGHSWGHPRLSSLWNTFWHSAGIIYMGAAPFLLSAACFDGTPPGRPQLERKQGEKSSIRNQIYTSTFMSWEGICLQVLISTKTQHSHFYLAWCKRQRNSIYASHQETAQHLFWDNSLPNCCKGCAICFRQTQ